MKKILALTDFSSCAENGIDAAIKIAEKMSAKILVFARINIPFNWHNLTEEERAQNPEAKAIIANTETLFNTLKTRYASNKVKIQTLYSGGKLLSAVEDLVQSAGIDLIVMGSHGASGLDEMFIGSNTQRIIRLVHCPVLVVKSPLNSAAFKNIVYASDFNMKDQKAFLRFLIFVRNFRPTIHLLSVNSLGFFSEPYVLTRSLMEKYRDMCSDDLKCKIHFISNPLIEPGIRKFAEEIKADLIVISNERRHPIKRIFAGSNVEALINHSGIPVMSLDFNE